jgi:hypothetical protein
MWGRNSAGGMSNSISAKALGLDQKRTVSGHGLVAGQGKLAELVLALSGSNFKDLAYSEDV